MGFYHQILGVAEDAAPDEIKRRYRELCKRYHPDINDGESIGRMALINEAYERLAKPGRTEPAAAATAGAGGLAAYKDQAFAFYKQGLAHFRAADVNRAFRDTNEWNPATRSYDRREAVDAFERRIFNALYYFNLICAEFGGSEWREDAADKIREINRRRVMLKNWNARFGAERRKDRDAEGGE